MRNRERWSRSQQTGKLSGKFFCLIFSTSAFHCAGQHSDTDHTSSASMLLPPITPLGKHQAGQHLMSNRSAFYVEYVSIPLCRSAFGYRSYLKCFNVTTANYPPRKTSSRSAFNVEQVSILCRIREHSIVQVSIRIPIISLCRSAFDHTSSVSMLLPPITLLGKHQAGQHLTSNRSAFHIPLRQRFAVQMQRSIRSLSLSSLPLSLINNYIHAYMCLTVGRQSRDHRPLSRDPSVSFYKKFPNCLKRPKTLFDSQPTVA